MRSVRKIKGTHPKILDEQHIKIFSEDRLPLFISLCHCAADWRFLGSSQPQALLCLLPGGLEGIGDGEQTGRGGAGHRVVGFDCGAFISYVSAQEAISHVHLRPGLQHRLASSTGRAMPTPPPPPSGTGAEKWETGGSLAQLPHCHPPGKLEKRLVVSSFPGIRHTLISQLQVRPQAWEPGDFQILTLHTLSKGFRFSRALAFASAKWR